MIKKMIRLFNCIVINNIKFLTIKIFHLNHFHFKFVNYISPKVHIDIQDKGKIWLGEKCNILENNFIGVREKGIIIIDNQTFLNRNCQVIAHNKINIGKNVCIGPNTIIMDHDHLFSRCGVEKKKFKSKPIIIEDNVWIGANVVILKGVTIGKNSVISAGAVVTKNVPDNSILIQKRNNYIKEMGNN